MVLQKAGQLVLVVQTRVEMLAHRQGMSVAEAVVQPFVVSIIESLLQQGPFQVPVDFGQEAEVRNPLAHAPDRRRPEGLGLDAPGPFKDFRQDKHGHIAAHAVALPCDLQELADHRFLRGRVAVVELQGVRPAREIRIAAVSQK